MQIIPSLLVQSKEEFTQQILEVQKYIKMVQIDIADGKFVPNTTWRDPKVTKELLKIDAELHLMTSNPVEETAKWADVHQIKRVLFHYEAVEKTEIAETINSIKNLGHKVGIVLNPDTSIDVLDEFISELDAVMFMGVVPGFQKQKYIPETTERIKNLKEKYPDLFVSLDGGVNLETIPDISTSGVDAICPGSAVFHTEKTIKENVEDLNQLIDSLTKGK